jgi:predicted RNA-binding protein with PIN domain
MPSPPTLPVQFHIREGERRKEKLHLFNNENLETLNLKTSSIAEQQNILSAGALFMLTRNVF